MGSAVTSATIEVGAWAVRTFSAYWVWEQRSDGRPFSPYTLYFQFLGNTNTFLKSIFFSLIIEPGCWKKRKTDKIVSMTHPI